MSLRQNASKLWKCLSPIHRYILFVRFCLAFQLPCLNVYALYALIYCGNGSILSANVPSKLFKLFLRCVQRKWCRWKMFLSDFWLKWFVNWIFRLCLRQNASLFHWIGKRFSWMNFRHAKGLESKTQVVVKTKCFFSIKRHMAVIR